MNKTELKRIEGRVTKYQRGLGGLAKKRIDRELIPIWRQPGWTTPAEFRMMLAIVDQMSFHVQALESLQSQVVELAQMVEAKG